MHTEQSTSKVSSEFFKQGLCSSWCRNCPRQLKLEPQEHNKLGTDVVAAQAGLGSSFGSGIRAFEVPLPCCLCCTLGGSRFSINRPARPVVLSHNTLEGFCILLHRTLPGLGPSTYQCAGHCCLGLLGQLRPAGNSVLAKPV
jgi:hypothetical protein